MRAKASLFVLLYCISSAVAAEVSISQLYKSYEKSGRSSDQMPEYNKKIAISGVVLKQTENFSGDVIISVGAPDSTVELARAIFGKDTPAEEIDKLTGGVAFKASCTVAFVMNSKYLSLQDCALNNRGK